MRRHVLKESSDENLAEIARDEAGTEVGREAAEQLLERYGPRVYGLCRKYVLNADSALDLSQDVLLSAFRAIATYEGRGAFSAWLFTIARNRCLRALRRPGWIQDEERDLTLAVDPAPGVETRLEMEQEEEIVRSVIETCLSPMEQKALFMRCTERLPVDEITRMLGIDQSSGARGVLQAARRKLRAALAARGIDPEGSR